MTVPISTGIISFALVIAFSDSVRTVIWLIYKYLITLTAIKSGAYDRVYLNLDWKSKDMVRKVEDRVAQMKAEVKAARQKRVKKHSKWYSPDHADEGSSSGSGGDGDTTEDNQSPGADARLNSTAAGAADRSASSGSRFRPRSLRLARSHGGDEDPPHVIRMDALSPAHPTSAASTVPPTSARSPVVHAVSAPGLLQP